MEHVSKLSSMLFTLACAIVNQTNPQSPRVLFSGWPASFPCHLALFSKSRVALCDMGKATLNAALQDGGTAYLTLNE